MNALIEHQGGEFLTVWIDGEDTSGILELEFEFTSNGVRFYKGTFEYQVDTMEIKQPFTTLVYRDTGTLRLENPSSGFIEVDIDREVWDKAYQLVLDDWAYQYRPKQTPSPAASDSESE